MKENPENDVYKLEIWKGDWGLPSVDVQCLKVMACARFIDAPLKIVPTNNPFWTPNGELPVLRTSKETIESRKIMDFLMSRSTVDFKNDPKLSAEVLAYETLLQEQLHPAMQFVWWLDQVNFHGLVRQWYARALPFPLNFIYPGRYEAQARTLMESLYPLDHENLQTLETEVYSNAQKCLNLLSTRLGESKYFFGAKPSPLDAIIYAYLAPILKTPLPHNALQNHLRGCTNLVKFVTHISTKYFESYHAEFEKENLKKVQEEEGDFPHKRRDQIVAGLVATAAMMGYALSTGIVEVWNNDSNAEETIFLEEDEEIDD